MDEKDCELITAELAKKVNNNVFGDIETTTKLIKCNVCINVFKKKPGFNITRDCLVNDTIF